MVSIDDTCEIITDGTHYTPPDVGEGIPFLTVKDISDKGLDFIGCSYIAYDEYVKADLGNSSPKVGDVLFSKDGTVGKVHVVSEKQEFAVLSSIAILRPKSDTLDSKYFGYILKSPSTLEQAIRRKTGSAIRRIILKDLKQVQIPLPPLEEQRRIAAILDKADGIRRKRKEAIRLTEELLRSAFLEMFGDPVTNPKGWKMFALEDLIVDIESGWSPKCDSQEAGADEWGVLKLGAVTWGHFNSSENKALLQGTVPRPELEVKPGDLLFSRKNTYQLVGASAFVHSTRSKLLFPDLIFRLRLKDTVNPVYIWQVLSQKTMRTELSKLASGSAGSMPNISKAKLRNLYLPAPPLEVQLKYYQIANLFWKEQNHYQEFLQSSDSLFNSLLQRAFRGEL
jgi:restriction endonuclease S subunit